MSDKKNLPYRIGVLLVNFNQWELTHNCVKTLLASVNVEITIALVDNNSSLPSPAWINTIPNIKFFQNKTNDGLTAGNNWAFSLLENEVDYIFILNNDTEVAKNTLFLLAEYLSKNQDVGITAPAIPFAENPNIIWSAGGKYINNRMILKQIYNTVSDLPSEPIEMEQVTGCAIMMNKKDYREVGLQDPELFVYYEDTDLCFKIRNLGKKIVLIPEARVIHHVSISVGGIFSPFAVYFTHRNRYIVARRYLRNSEFFLFFLYYTAVTMTKTLIYPLKGRSKLVPWMWLAFKHGLQNLPQIRPEGLFNLRSKV